MTGLTAASAVATRRSTEQTADCSSASTVLELLAARAARSPDAPAQWSYSSRKRWESLTWSALQARVAELSRGLRAAGLQPGDRVAIAAAGRAEWDQVHLAVLAAGGVAVGLDTHSTASQRTVMLELVQPNWLVADDPAVLVHLAAKVPATLRFILTLFEGAVPEWPSGCTCVSFDALLARGREGDSAWNIALPEDAAWMIFTSGTTGQPKAVLYRQRQISLAVDAILDAFDDIVEGARLVSWLPLSNPFQRIINLCAVARGAQTFYVTDPREVMQHLPSIRPHVFIGVPRFFEKVHGAMTQRLEASAMTALLGSWALAVGHRHASTLRAGGKPTLWLSLTRRVADALVLRRLRTAFGSDLRYLVSGSAAMPVWLLERLHAMGLLVLEAYGLSECIVPVAANRPRAYRFGSVGHPMKGVEVRMAADGELLLRSAGVFDGYLGPSANDGPPIDRDGFLASGDYAETDADGFIRLVGRKSEVFKTSTGRRVAPTAVEAALRRVPGVEHAAVFGDGRKSLLAVVGVDDRAAADVSALRAALLRHLQELPDYLRPAGLVVTRKAFSIEAGELTGNLKLRRQAVRDAYAPALEALAALVDRPDAEGGAEKDFEPGVVRLVAL